MSNPNNIKKGRKSLDIEKSRSNRTLLDAAREPSGALLTRLKTQLTGLSEEDSSRLLDEFGYNDVSTERPVSSLKRLFDIVRNPLILLLIVLAIVSYITDDRAATAIISILIAVSIVLRFFQERNADKAAAKLKAMVSTTATVMREGSRKEIPMREIVVGDIVLLSAGDMVPADIRILSAKDLFVNQASLTGESMPVEKNALSPSASEKSIFSLQNMCFLGSNIESGTATGVAVITGKETFMGSMAAKLSQPKTQTSFDNGIKGFTWLMISFMCVMVPLVFVINGFTSGWAEALLFSLAVAVGLTPEMLPMIVTVNLSRGAIAMSRKKVIVKRLNSIQNFGAMDILCTDKTGTITQGKVVLERYLDIYSREIEKVFEYAYINSYFQTGLKNLIDIAILNHAEQNDRTPISHLYHKIDEIPFDFMRRRMSVVVANQQGECFLVCKGATEEILGLCTNIEIKETVIPFMPEHIIEARTLVDTMSDDGFRVLALAYKNISADEHSPTFSVSDESQLTLLGFLAFFDPPRESASEALEKLHQNAVDVKILTGDNDVVTASICRQVGLSASNVILGQSIDEMDDNELSVVATQSSVFAKLSPIHKERIIRALQRKGHVVGFLGDGINDAPALKAADVGISVDTAVDIAKESSDIILLENSLLVLEEGVLEGRRVFGNITKYLKMAASSNFGNMLSVVGASIFLPFLPMLPLQILINNLLYDFSQTTIPTDRVDQEWLSRPRKWSIRNIRRFIFFIGPISSVFDYATFFILLVVFKAGTNPELFHTGWFVVSIFTQTLIIHVIRTNRIPFIQSRASLAMILSSIIVVCVGAFLTISPIAGYLGFVKLPTMFWLYLAVILVCYVVLTQFVKTWFIKRFGD